MLLADIGEDSAAETNLVHTMADQVDGVIIARPSPPTPSSADRAEVEVAVLIDRALLVIAAALMELASGVRP